MYLEQLATVCGIELVLDTDFLFGLRVVPRSIRESAKVAGARLTAIEGAPVVRPRSLHSGTRRDCVPRSRTQLHSTFSSNFARYYAEKRLRNTAAASAQVAISQGTANVFVKQQLRC